MKQFRLLYKLSFYFLALLIFVFGGLLQYLFAVPNTFITYGIVFYLFVIYLLYVLIKSRIVLSRVVMFAILYTSTIFLSSIINQSNVISTLIYLIFPLLPLGVYLFCYINYKENIINVSKVLVIFYYISAIQLPFLLIQKNFYNFLIQFNFSGQIIHSYDFMFGTFFIKSDHSLAIFILFIIVNILLNRNGFRDKLKYPILSIIYLSVTVFLTESNISKFFLVVLLTLSIIFPLYKKYKNRFKFKLIALIVLIALALFTYNLKDQKFIEDRFGGSLERQFSISTAERQFELGNAKRSQILIMMANRIETKWIGDGPYSYFDILTGEFKKTKHFTQFIWTYFDLGIIGLTIVLLYLFSILKYLDIDNGPPRLMFFGVILVYFVYTTVFSDIAIMYSLIIIFNKKNLYESNIYSIS